MLLRFSLSNYLSIAEEQSVLFTASGLTGEDVQLLSSDAVPKQNMLPAIVIYGPNASGKSNLISGLAAMAAIVVNSHKMGGPNTSMPFTPFLLDDESIEKPTSFEIDFVREGARYSYSFSYNKRQVEQESLYITQGAGTSLLFDRTAGEFRFGRKLSGQLATLKALTRPNSLFISTAAQNNHEQLSEVFNYFSSIVFEGEDAPKAMSAEFRISKELHHVISKKVISFLSAIGTGVVDYRAVEIPMSDESRKRAQKLGESIRNAFREIEGDDGSHPQFEFHDSTKRAELGHRGKDGNTTFMGLEKQSAGTRRLLVALPNIFRALEVGLLVCVDEVDISLHTLAADLVLKLFSNQRTNPHGAQLLATTHDTNLLDSDYLRRDQVLFCEKNDVGKTRIYPLSDFKPRKGENMERNYLQGRYGAIPRGSHSRLSEYSLGAD